MIDCMHAFGALAIGMKRALTHGDVSGTTGDKPMKNLHIPFE
jgi:hypothetical protein